MMEEMQELGESIGQHENSKADQDKDSEPKSEEPKSGEPKSEQAQKDEVFNQMMNIKSMLGRYTLIRRK